MKGPERPVTLPDEVIALLEADDMTGAIHRLLALNPGMDKLVAMRAVMHYRMGRHKSGAYLKHLVKAGDPGHTGYGNEPRETWTLPYTLVNLGAFLAFVWLFINLFVLLASLIILANVDGYRRVDFQVDRAYYVSDSEAGDAWGLRGRVAGTEMRFSDPGLLPSDGENPVRYMERQHPPGSTLPLLYNPDVTDDLFQGRTINLIPWSQDPATAERERVMAWLMRCLLPFAGFLLASWLMRKTTTTVHRKS